MAGCAAGAFCAVAWFIVTAYLRHCGWIDWALDTRLAAMLRFRDLVVTEDLVDAGWDRWKKRRNNSRTRSIKETKAH